MADTTRTPCTPDNCGDNFPACGQVKTYNHCKCRCDACREANAEASRRYYATNREKRAEKTVSSTPRIGKNAKDTSVPMRPRTAMRF